MVGISEQPGTIVLLGNGPSIVCNVTTISTLATLQLLVYHLNENLMAVAIVFCLFVFLEKNGESV